MEATSSKMRNCRQTSQWYQNKCIIYGNLCDADVSSLVVATNMHYLNSIQKLRNKKLNHTRILSAAEIKKWRYAISGCIHTGEHTLWIPLPRIYRFLWLEWQVCKSQPMQSSNTLMATVTITDSSHSQWLPVVRDRWWLHAAYSICVQPWSP